jgi:hypothetical protein
MITQIEVDGFKSLSNFKMTLNPGLNVLVAWLKNAKPYKMKLFSPSLSKFYEALSELGCRWLQQESLLFDK